MFKVNNVNYDDVLRILEEAKEGFDDYVEQPCKAETDVIEFFKATFKKDGWRK